MKFKQEHLGKWVAASNDKVIASDKTLTKLVKKIKKDNDPNKLKFTLVPKGHIAG